MCALDIGQCQAASAWWRKVTDTSFRQNMKWWRNEMAEDRYRTARQACGQKL